MSAFLAGSPVVAKVAAKPVAKRNVTVRAAAPSECVSRHISRSLPNAAGPRNVATRRRAPRLTSDASPRSLPPRGIIDSGVTRRAAVAGVLALFVAQPVRPPSRSASFPTPPSRAERRAAIRARRATKCATHPSPPPDFSPRFVSSTPGLRRDQARALEGERRAVQPLLRVHVEVRGLRVRQVQGSPRVPQG